MVPPVVKSGAGFASCAAAVAECAKSAASRRMQSRRAEVLIVVIG
jgi:hypothetical protein